MPGFLAFEMLKITGLWQNTCIREALGLIIRTAQIYTKPKPKNQKCLRLEGQHFQFIHGNQELKHNPETIKSEYGISITRALMLLGHSTRYGPWHVPSHGRSGINREHCQWSSPNCLYQAWHSGRSISSIQGPLHLGKLHI